MADFDRIITAYQAHIAAERALDKVVREEFPVGSDIAWLHGSRHPQTGTVEYADGNGFIIANDRTGRSIRTSLYSVLQEAGRENDLFSQPAAE